MSKTAQKTKTLICEKALELFNANGSHAATTNRIAEAASISPGNLYYHYKNKEEIIRDIFKQLVSDFDDLWNESGSETSVAEIFLSLVKRQLELQITYRFFFLELAMLLKKDSFLAELYKANHSLKIKSIEHIFLTLSKKNFIELEEQNIESLTTNSWIISEFYLCYLDTTGTKITKKTINQLQKNIYYLIRPYLKKTDQVEIDSYFSDETF